MRRLRALAFAGVCVASCSGITPPPIFSQDASARDTGASSPPLPSIEGSFTDITATLGPLPFGIDPGDMMSAEPESIVGLFTDLDGDGQDELLISPSRTAMAPLANRRAHVWRLDRASGEWRSAGPVAGDGDLVVMAVTDLDEDGHPDLLLGQEALPGVVLVAWGRAGGFDPPTALSDQPTLGNFGSGVILLDDLDGDGWTDLVVGNRFCTPGSRLVVPFLRSGPRTFLPALEMFPASAGSSLYGLLSLRPTPEIHYVVALGQGCGSPPPTFFQRGAPAPSGQPRFAVADPVPSAPYFNSFQLQPRLLSEFAPMAGAITDLGTDGIPDLYISLDPFRTFYETVPGARFRDLSEASGVSTGFTPSGTKMIPWSAAFLDLNRDMLPDLVVTHGNDQGAWYQPSNFLGPQRTSALVNLGGARFRDIAAQVGLQREGQWRSLAVGDPDRDGDPDLLVGGQGESPRLYRNDLRVPGHAVSFRVVGTTSGRAANGARVTVRAGGLVTRAWAGDSSGPYTTSESMMFLSTGAATRAESVEVDWPSGLQQVLRDVASDTLHVLTEPRVLSVSPAGRHARADGASIITVQVTPRGPDGAPRDGAVSARVVQGDCSPDAAERAGEAWSLPVRAPSAAGSCVVEVSIDGQALRVRPRLWWD